MWPILHPYSGFAETMMFSIIMHKTGLAAISASSGLGSYLSNNCTSANRSMSYLTDGGIAVFLMD